MPEPSNRVATPVSQAQSAPIIERTARIYELSKGTLIVRIPSFGDCAEFLFPLFQQIAHKRRSTP